MIKIYALIAIISLIAMATIPMTFEYFIHVFSVIMAIYHIVGYIFNLKTNPSHDDIEKAKLKNKEALEIEEERTKLINKKRTILNNANRKAALSVLPGRYNDYNSWVILKSYFDNHRADTLKEAINLYEDEKHKKDILRIHQNSVNEQRKLNELQKQSLRKMDESNRIAKEAAENAEAYRNEIRRRRKY